MKLHKLTALAAALMVAACSWAQDSKPKYIFYFIGDGMGPGPVMTAMDYSRYVKGHKDLLMTTFPVTGFAQTWSASSPVTDSAAAGTALSTGSKTRNGMLGMDADTLSVTSVARHLKDAGWGVGIVTNCAADDATPGAFYAHQPNRSMYYEIGKDAASSGYDFIAGAGLRGLVDKKTGKPTDLYEVLEQNNVQVLHGAKGVKEVYTTTAKKIMLTNPVGYGDPSTLGYVIDNEWADSIGMTLKGATAACLYHLEKNSPDRFFMMVEGGLIDHALHGNDGAAVLHEVLDFDQTLQIAFDFYKAHPQETLIVVTADHDTGGMAIGNTTLRYDARFANLDHQKISKTRFSDLCKAILKSRQAITWDEMKEILTVNFGFWDTIKITDKQTAKLRKKFDETFVKRDAQDEKGLYDNSNAFAAQVIKTFNDNAGLGYTSLSHTGNLVPVFAIGAGAQSFGRILNNIEIPAIMRGLAL